MLASLLLMFVFTFQAQSQEKGKMSSSKKKTFTIDHNGKKTVVELNIYENRNYEMKWDKADKGKIDQDRTSALAKVTKLIALKSNHETINDRFVVLRYDRQVTDTFEVLPIPNGFMVTVDQHKIRYVFKKGKYVVDTPDNDFFIVEEFVSN